MATLYVMDGAFLWHFVRTPQPAHDQQLGPPQPTEVRSLAFSFEGADPAARCEGVDPLPGRVHFFRGNDPARWRTDVPTYARVRTAELYRGISMEAFVGANEAFEYDLVLEPLADPNQVVARMDGAESMSVDAEGSLVFQLGDVTFRHLAPIAYQDEPDGSRRPVECRYRLLDEHRVAFDLGDYDASRRLVIDPPTPAPVATLWFTYFGGSQNDHASDVAVLNGKVYVLGATTSGNLPTTPGAYDTTGPTTGLVQRDMFVAKFNVEGGLVYSTFIGSDTYDEWPHAIDVDRTGAAYIALTAGKEYPTTPGAFQVIYGDNHDGAVTKLSPDGSALVYSTYLGGQGADYCFGIAVDHLQRAVVCGSTVSFMPHTSILYPITAGVVEPTASSGLLSVPCVTKLSADGSVVVWSTFVAAQYQLGEATFSAAANALVLDEDERPTVVGQTTYKFALPGAPNTYNSQYSFGTMDAFVAQLEPDGTAYRFLTHFGGSGRDQGLAVACDPAGSIVITGRTNSPPDSPPPFPLVQAFDTIQVGQEAFVARFDPAQTGVGSLLLSSYLGGGIAGGGIDDMGTGIATDSSGRIYVCGYTASANAPIFQVNGLMTFRGQWDVFVTKITDNVVTFSTYLGGSGGDTANGLAIDAGGLYLIGQTGAIDVPLGLVNDFYQNLDILNPLTTLPGFDTSFNGGTSTASQGGGSNNYTLGFPSDTMPFMYFADAFLTKIDKP